MFRQPLLQPESQSDRISLMTATTKATGQLRESHGPQVEECQPHIVSTTRTAEPAAAARHCRRLSPHWTASSGRRPCAAGRQAAATAGDTAGARQVSGSRFSSCTRSVAIGPQYSAQSSTLACAPRPRRRQHRQRHRNRMNTSFTVSAGYTGRTPPSACSALTIPI